MSCGECVRCLERTRSLLRTPAVRARALPAPTAEALLRHAKKFGPELVAETAEELGVSVSIERPKAKRRARGPSLKSRIRKLQADGYTAEQIAVIEDLSPALARQLREESGAA